MRWFRRRSVQLLCNAAGAGGLDYENQLQMINELYEELDILVKAKTHGPRRAGARFLEERG